jgi:hypothetical protein
MCKSGGMQLNLISNLSKENLKSFFWGILLILLS